MADMKPIASSLIMVIDDDHHVRSALTELFTDEGYRVVAIADGGEALRYLSSQELPQVILLDLMMPVLDGWQFRAEQVMNPALAAIPVIVITAQSGVDPTRDLGVELVSKPFDTHRLLSLVRRHCGPGRSDGPRADSIAASPERAES